MEKNRHALLDMVKFLSIST